MLRARYAEVAYCRVMAARARAEGKRERERFYKRDAEAARRCVEALLKPRKHGVVVFPGMRAELDLWVRLSLSRPDAVVDAPRKAAGEPGGTGGPPDAGLRCACCESIGHTVDACPFALDDAQVLRTAKQRRERRARSAEAA